MATTAVKKKTGSMKVQHVVSRVLIYALLIIVAALMLVPFLWMLSASFKMNKDVFPFPIEWIPSNPRPQNYIDIWTKIPLLTFVKNTAFLTIVVTILQVLTSSFAAYAFAKLNFKGKNVLFGALLATMMIPGELFTITNYSTVTNLGWMNTYTVLIVPFLVSVFYIYLLRQNFMQIPNELYLAAKVDGTSDFKYLWKVMIPLSLPTLISITILKMMGAWNSYIWPRLVANDEAHRLITNGLETVSKLTLSMSVISVLLLLEEVISVLP